MGRGRAGAGDTGAPTAFGAPADRANAPMPRAAEADLAMAAVAGVAATSPGRGALVRPASGGPPVLSPGACGGTGVALTEGAVSVTGASVSAAVFTIGVTVPVTGPASWYLTVVTTGATAPVTGASV